MACVCSVWLTCAIFNIKLVVKHISGKFNNYADMLSRWHVYRMINNPQVELIKNAFGITQKYRICFQTLIFNDTYFKRGVHAS